MRKALIVGIDYYTNIGSLSGAVNDAHGVKTVLERNADATANFRNPRLIAAAGADSICTRADLRNAVEALFSGDPEIALFYFAGHGYIDVAGGFLCASDCNSGHDGLALSEVLVMATRSRARNKIIILDSCHSGIAGSHPLVDQVSEIADGMTILTASTSEQYAMEGPNGGSGVFTNLLIDALSGTAANLIGDVTPGSVYAHIDQSLGPWAQRPVFKTNVQTFVSLRKANPPIGLGDLHQITSIFELPTTMLILDPSYEPERSTADVDTVIPPDPAKTAVFKVLQNYVRVNLVRPVGAPHMWHAAMDSKSCELTALGQHYWKLINEGLI